MILFQLAECLNLQNLDVYNFIYVLYIAQYNKYIILNFLSSASDLKEKFFTFKHKPRELKILIIFVCKFLWTLEQYLILYRVAL